jgi:cysteine desulfurase
VVFTGNACEAINLAMRGCGSAGPIAYSAIEHPAVRDTAISLGNAYELPVDSDGITDPGTDLAPGTRLVAVMQVNNEIGTVQPVAEWARKAREAGALLLCDAVQAFGKLPVAEADVIAISAHKLYGPKGIGALWVRNGIDLEPQITGGLQEGWRSGTLSPALCAGFGAAAKLADEALDRDAEHLGTLWKSARTMFSSWELNGSATHRWQGNLNIRRDGLDVARLMSDCRQVMFSAGSACASGSGKPSHVLKAIGLSDGQSKNSIRLGFGRYTTLQELGEAAALINAAAEAQ